MSISQWSRITATVAVILLMTASIDNNAAITCSVADPGVFASGAVLSFVTLVLGLVRILYYKFGKEQ